MRLFAFTALFLLAFSGNSQIKLDLRQCLEIGVENNLSLRQVGNTVSSAEIALVQRKFDFLPSVNASLSAFRNIGTTVDNFTQQIAQSPTTSNPSLNSSIVLFNGFSKWNALEAAKYDLAAVRYSQADLRNDIRVNIALTFFQAIFSQENLLIAQERETLIRRQLERTENLVQAGSATKGDALNVKAQLATEKLNVVNSQNAQRQAMTNLILVLNLDPKEQYEIVRPNIEGLAETPVDESLEAVYQSSESFSPALKQQEAQIRSGEYNIKVARASFYPTLTLGYGISSFYSSNSREALGVEVDSIFGIRPLYGQTIPLFNQFSNNFNQGLGLSLNIPIFNNYRVRQAYLQSELNLDNNLLGYEIARNELYNEVLKAYQDVDAAASRLSAAREQVEAVTLSFEFAQTRYESGLIDFYSYMESLNNKTQAENELLQSRYDFVLKRKVIDLYQGKTLDF